MTTDRRRFLKQSATGVAALSAVGCRPAPQAPALTGDTLSGLAEAVLPSELDRGDRERVVQEFTQWVDAFEPAAELDHGYISSDIEYAPADPAPGWAAQLDALERVSRKTRGVGFAELSVADRRAVIRQQVGDDPTAALPPPIRARHVAIALMAHFYASAAAADLCYEATIGDRTCRALAGATEVRPLTGEGEDHGSSG